jgi:hypothetical protein
MQAKPASSSNSSTAGGQPPLGASSSGSSSTTKAGSSASAGAGSSSSGGSSMFDVGSRAGFYTEKSPKLLLHEWCTQQKRPRPKFKAVALEQQQQGGEPGAFR